VGQAGKILKILSDHDNMRLCRTMFFVKDLDRMVSFYGETLGLKVIEETRIGNFVEFDAGGGTFALHAIPREIADQIEISSPLKPREKCPVKLTFEVEDAASEIKRLQGLGVTIIQRPWGVCDAVDPEGNIFQLSDGR
jgi:catechol 2,3-dioxygenase-like lactoylglutathione lyase family enzyme